MEATATFKKYKGAIFAGLGVLAAMAIVILSGLIVSCSSQADAGSIGAKEGVVAMMDETDSLAASMLEDEDEPAEDVPAQDTNGSIVNEEGLAIESARSSDDSSHHGSAGSAFSASTSASSQSAPASSQSAPQRKWVEETQKVWVEDRAAWTESIPVYGTKEVSICNVCGADITGNTSAHGKAHMMAGEGSGHHSEVRQVVTGHNTVSHPAEGHYETRVTGGHWE